MRTYVFCPKRHVRLCTDICKRCKHFEECAAREKQEIEQLLRDEIPPKEVGRGQ